MLERIHQDHETLRRLGREMRALLPPALPADLKPLEQVRWNMVKTLMQHVGYEDQHVYLLLERDERPQAAATAKRFRATLTAMLASYEKHSAHWTGAAIATDWATYRHGALTLIETLERRMKAEEDDLLPLIEGNQSARMGTGPAALQFNWARIAWKVRDSISQH